jgi:hypothetical protein
MGFFKNLINKVLDAEVPPVIEQLVRKKYGETTVSAEISPVLYTERYIPDNSDDAKGILAEQEKHKNETTEQRLKRFAKENRECMESADLKMYTWDTSGDERVRPCCRKMDGKLCLWSDPTVYSRNKGKDWIPRPQGAPTTHPGEEGGCRCTALSYEPELLGEL